jgi:hypothetical protein
MATDNILNAVMSKGNENTVPTEFKPALGM